MTETTNYKMKKAGQDDFYNVDDVNSALDIADTQLKQNENAINAHANNKNNPHGVTIGQIGAEAAGSSAAVAAAVEQKLALKAPIASPALSGTPTVPTAGIGSTAVKQIANLEFVNNALAALVASSPEALNTLNELALAIGNDPNFATTVTNQIAEKAKRAANATSGHLAALDGLGNLVDCGKVAGDFENAGSMAAHNADNNAHAGQFAKVKRWNLQLSAGGWGASAPYTQTVSASGMSASYEATYRVRDNANEAVWQKQLEEVLFIKKMSTNNGSITAVCKTDKPTAAIDISLEVIY